MLVSEPPPPPIPRSTFRGRARVIIINGVHIAAVVWVDLAAPTVSVVAQSDHSALFAGWELGPELGLSVANFADGADRDEREARQVFAAHAAFRPVADSRGVRVGGIRCLCMVGRAAGSGRCLKQAGIEASFGWWQARPGGRVMFYDDVPR